MGGWGLLIWSRFLNNYPRSWSIICPPTLQPNVPICKIGMLFKAIVIQIMGGYNAQSCNQSMGDYFFSLAHYLPLLVLICYTVYISYKYLDIILSIIQVPLGNDRRETLGGENNPNPTPFLQLSNLWGNLEINWRSRPEIAALLAVIELELSD